jgi:siroheme synthase
MAATAHLTLVAPDTEKFTVQSAPARLPRRRDHLTEREVERLIEAMKGNRWGHRDATVDLQHAFLHVRRLKNGSPATHLLTGKELRALRRLQR